MPQVQVHLQQAQWEQNGNTKAYYVPTEGLLCTWHGALFSKYLPSDTEEVISSLYQKEFRVLYYLLVPDIGVNV